jgi:hypothetical protein
MAALWECRELRLIQGRERSAQPAAPLSLSPSLPPSLYSLSSISAAPVRAEGRGQVEWAS